MISEKAICVLQDVSKECRTVRMETRFDLLDLGVCKLNFFSFDTLSFNLAMQQNKQLLFACYHSL